MLTRLRLASRCRLSLSEMESKKIGLLLCHEQGYHQFSVENALQWDIEMTMISTNGNTHFSLK